MVSYMKSWPIKVKCQVIMFIPKVFLVNVVGELWHKNIFAIELGFQLHKKGCWLFA